MAETMWHYVLDGATVGPVAHADLCTLFADKELPLETPVWHGGLADWVAASGVDEFRGIWGKGFARREPSPPPLPPDAIGAPGRRGLAPVSPAPSPAVPLAPTVRPSLEVSSRHRSTDDPWDQRPQVRPWVRFWARTLDAHLLFTAAAFVFMPATAWESLGFFFVVLFLGAFVVYPVQLMMFGRTLGKVVFGMTVETEEGEPLTLPQAVAREWGVLLNGLGLGLFILPLFTQIVAYKRLVREGAASWDVSGGLVVRHRGVGPLRWLAFLFLLGACNFTQAALSPRFDLDFNLDAVRRHAAMSPAPAMGSIDITPTTPHPSTRPAAPKKPRPKPKLLTLPGDKGAWKPPVRRAPTTRPARRADRPAPGVTFKPAPAPESN